jgi:hypothetical protein
VNLFEVVLMAEQIVQRIAIVGSRHFRNWRLVADYVNSLPPGTVVMSGGAYGVDSWAEKAAKDRRLKTDIYPIIKPPGGFAHKGEFRDAAMSCNKDIVRHADAVVSFWDGSSRGTLSTIHIAREQSKPVHIFFPNDAQVRLEDRVD